MNKAIKGSIAAGAAGLLLLGGAGTLAQWKDSTDIDAGKVTAGQLRLALGTDGAWNDWTSKSAVPITDISSFRIVPGDTLIYTTTATINAEGNNLAGTLTVAQDNLPAGTSAVIKTQENEEGLSAVGNTFSFTRAGTYTVGVTLTVNFNAEGLTDQGVELNLNDIALTLQQEMKYA